MENTGERTRAERDEREHTNRKAPMSTSSKPKLTTGTAVLFAIAASLAVGNLYWAQPLLAQIAGEFGIPTSQGGFLITATQIGYSLGVLLIVPLGDVLHRKKLIGIIMGTAAVMLLACSLAPSFIFLAFALSGVGLVTVTGQILLPLAGDLATSEDRGRLVGIVAAGMTTGVLMSRFISGIVADIWSWRTIYMAAAVLNFIMMLAFTRLIPETPKGDHIPYPRLIADVFTSVFRYPTLTRVLAINGLVFGIAFNLFWTSLTFLLSAEPFNFSTFQIGLVSLAGLTGAFAAVGAGKLQDMGLGIPAMGVTVTVCAICMVASVFCQTSVVAIFLIAGIFSLGIQGTGILGQTRVFTLTDTERSRLNSTYVVSNFICCAIGSALASVLWDLGGWPAITAGATTACLLALAVWALSRKQFAEDEAKSDN